MNDLDLAPPELRALAMDGEWDPVEQEPNLDILLRSRRELDANGVPCSRWEFLCLVDGEKIPMSQVQRDYAGAFMRQLSRVVQEPPAANLSLEANITLLARRAWQEARAAKTLHANLAEYAVRTLGLPIAARLLKMKEHQLAYLLKSRKKLPTMVTPEAPELPKHRSVVFAERT